MSDNELSDDMEELQEILREYSDKAAASTKESTTATDKSHFSDNENLSDNEAPTTSGPKNQILKSIKSEEEIRLEKFIFGDREGLLENLKKSSKPKSDDEPSKAKKRKPAWNDEDDEDLNVGEIKRETKFTGSLDHLQKDKSYKDYLKTAFNRITAAPKWAELDREDEPDSDEEILRTVGFIDRSKSVTLPAKLLYFKKMKDLNRATYAEGPITSIQFHPTSTAAMVSGLSGIATLYSIDGLKNEKLHSIRFADFPIHCAKILPCGTQAMFSSKFARYYTYDLMKATEMRHSMPHNMKIMNKFEISPCGKYYVTNGRFGELHLFDLKSKEFIHTFKQEEHCKAITFSLDSSKIITSSKASTVYIFDVRQQRMMHSFIDDGCIKGQSLTLSPDGKMMATGSREGAVNIYDYSKVFASKAPQPEKTILNLTTSITDLKFNHTSEMLALCSNMVPAGLKIVHFPTGTVFANFPGFKSDLRHIQTIEFSPSSGFLAMGCKNKQAPLYRLKHFNNY